LIQERNRLGLQNAKPARPKESDADEQLDRRRLVTTVVLNPYKASCGRPG